ncbi:MAG: bifunctional homocysteine S-methyltransferase/methylenetetrahydrofolate reductase [Actinomycetota bacterium]
MSSDRRALAALLEGGPVVADGGTGTSLVARGARPDACFDWLNVSDRDLVREVHTSFVEAGAAIIETNTFGANRYKLAAHDLLDRVREINVAGIARAREAGARIIAGSVGPLGVRLAPYGRVSAEDARAAFAEQIEALAEGGADLILLETHSDVAEIEQAARAARDVTDLPVIATMTFTRDDRTLLGETARYAAERLVAAGVDAIGVNCSEGPEQVLRLVLAMKPYANGLPLIAQPNAGSPQRLGGRILYSATPEYFAEYAARFAAAGCAVIGGCCGTEPAHIRAIVSALAEPAVRLDVSDETYAEPSDVRAEPVPAESAFARALSSGRRVITVEMDPPRGFSAARLVAAAHTIRDAGADAIDIADSPMARMRMSPWAACHLVQDEAGIESILHFPTRGRNLLRIQSDLLAAYALGIRNIFAVLGDSTRIGDFPEAADLADVTPSGLIALIKGSLNAGQDRAGSSIGDPTSFLVGCALNVNAADLVREARNAARKIAAGADYALTQAVFDPARLDTFRSVYESSFGKLELPILAGVLPLVSRRHAEFLHNEVPGIDIPDAIRKRIASASNEREEGLSIAVELASAVEASSAGLYLIPPFGRYDLAAEFIERARA